MNSNDFRYKLARFFQGRTGVDNICRLCCYIAILLMIVTAITGSTIIYLISMIFIGYSVWRMLNKNYQKRYQENQWYIKKTQKLRFFLAGLRPTVSKKISKIKSDINLRKTYKYFTCPSCNQKLRAPRGRGKIEVTCSKCKNQFIRKV